MFACQKTRYLCCMLGPQWNHTNNSPNKKSFWRKFIFLLSYQNCCIMSLTLLDEFKKPFWCVCSPVSMKLVKMPTSYDYDGEHFLIHYQDSDGQVKMNLVWMKEQMQFLIISLVVYVTTCKVNKRFSRDYWACSISRRGFEVFHHYHCMQLHIYNIFFIWTECITCIIWWFILNLIDVFTV